MKPHRFRMVYDLVVGYGLSRKMKILETPKATDEEICRFHTKDYLEFLRVANPDAISARFDTCFDSPVFYGIYEFCRLSAGGSIAAARQINNGTADVAINWAGGLHHAKRGSASGFCYVNDCVLGILELLNRFERVMYIDIDIHHGDGVEEAFYTTDRVLTVSFHKYGNNFFPLTGAIDDIGVGAGKYYAVNVPLKDGMDDKSYESIFKPVIDNLINWYRPGAIFLQCGADSLTGDQLGCFNLSIRGHGELVKFVKSFGLPLIAAGGGGYTVRNVARCWAYETAVLLGENIEDTIPETAYREYYGPDYRIDLIPSKMQNQNTEESLRTLEMTIRENLRHLPCAPSVQICGGKKDLLMVDSDSEDEDTPYDTRIELKYTKSKISLNLPRNRRR